MLCDTRATAARLRCQVFKRTITLKSVSPLQDRGFPKKRSTVCLCPFIDSTGRGIDGRAGRDPALPSYGHASRHAVEVRRAAADNRPACKVPFAFTPLD